MKMTSEQLTSPVDISLPPEEGRGGRGEEEEVRSTQIDGGAGRFPTVNSTAAAIAQHSSSGGRLSPLSLSPLFFFLHLF